MANVVCAKSLWRNGVSYRLPADCGKCGGGLPVARNPSFPVAVNFSSRSSWINGVQDKRQLTRHGSLRRRIGPVHSSLVKDTSPFAGVKAEEAALAERPCSQQSSGPSTTVLDQWIERSVPEIVRHLPEAPFLQYVFNSNTIDGTTERQRVSNELFDKPENWGTVRQCLLESAPDGLILVHRLDQDGLSDCCLDEFSNSDESRSGSSLQAGGSRTDVWGVLVQGCSMRCNACYILKTTQVASSTGVLSHFCLSRAKCFGPSIKQQLQRTWLL